MKTTVFAIDHRKIDRWDLPFTRLGTGFSNNAELRDSDGENILQYDKLLSEGTAMWWAWRNIDRFPDSDNVGFCHYRRFFTLLKPNFGAFPIHRTPNSLIGEYVRHMLSEEQLGEIIAKYGVSGVVPAPFPDYSISTGCSGVRQLMSRQSALPDMNLGMSDELCSTAFDILLGNTPTELRPHMEKAFGCLNTYHFNMFVLRRDLFMDLGDILWKSAFQAIGAAEELSRDAMHERWAGYLLERYVSCILLAMQYSGERFAQVPVLMFEKEECR